MDAHGMRERAFRAAVPYTLPILAGFLFLGVAYGVYMRASGFAAAYPIAMSATIFAGSMEFVAADLLRGAFDPLGAFVLTLMVNARHLFYGVSMLDRYRGTGLKKPYLIFGMCDESFSINCTADIPPDADRGWFMLFVTLLNQCYWIAGATLGSVLGSLGGIPGKGLDFVMTALFVVLFLEQWRARERRTSLLAGTGAALLCRILFGPNAFILPAMGLILVCLWALRPALEGKEAGA